ncbi:MAG: hypothetical protein RL748_4065 [Pseudomonadota bacterium]|jgi:hypothetical protein
MISPRAIRLLLRHFDAIDQVVSRRMTRKRPWAEEALTGLLCDLLDAETQEEEKVSYTLQQLHEDLAQSDEPISIRLRIDSHQYPKHLERWVTQSDFGFIVNYQDQFESSHSTRLAWLLQAKRVFPEKDGTYDVNSSFKSIDAEQHARMKALRDWAGEEFIRYFLYCPRPKELGPYVREELNQRRINALSDNIFDYTLGLELRDDILSATPTTAAGMFVGSLDNTPKTLGETHSEIFSHSIPFAWFIVHHLAVGRSIPGNPRDRGKNIGPRHLDIERLVRGDHRVLEGFPLPESLNENQPPRILPAHTIEISVVCGTDRPRN